jgi:ribosome-binding protein aMBF1 (putative translation factor)
MQKPHPLILIVRGLIVIVDDSIVTMADDDEQEIQKHFGERVRELRKQKGLSQEALALACNLDRTYIGGVERGERNISLINIYGIATALEVPPSALLERSVHVRRKTQ